MEATAETFLALIKAVAISTERARGFTSFTIMAEKLVEIRGTIVHFPGLEWRLGLV
jgi:hypothetical protein